MIHLSLKPSLLGVTTLEMNILISGRVVMVGTPAPYTLPPDWLRSMDCLLTGPHLDCAVPSPMFLTSPTYHYQQQSITTSTVGYEGTWCPYTIVASVHLIVVCNTAQTYAQRILTQKIQGWGISYTVLINMTSSLAVIKYIWINEIISGIHCTAWQ